MRSVAQWGGMVGCVVWGAGCGTPSEEKDVSYDIGDTTGTVPREESDADTDADSDADTDSDTDADTDTDTDHDIRGAWTTGSGWLSIESGAVAMVDGIDPWRRWQFVDVDHAAGEGVALNLENTGDDGYYSAFAWRADGDLAWWCQAVSDADSQSEAAAGYFDASDPGAGGCGVRDDPWTRLFPGEWLDIRGVWFAFGGENRIEEDTWTLTAEDGLSAWRVMQYDNAAKVLIAENASGTDFPGKYSRVDWAEVGADTYVCFSAVDRESVSDAAAVPRADDADPAVGGCEGAPWELLDAEPPVAPVESVGTWEDPSTGIALSISGTTISVTAAGRTQQFHVQSYDNTVGWVVSENDAGNPVDPGLFSRMDWRFGASAAELYWCWTASNHGSQAAAEADDSADDSQVEVTGCGAQPWTLFERTGG